jgi:hypothetical protein
MSIDTRKQQIRTLGSLLGKALFGTTEELQQTGSEIVQDVQGQVRARREGRELAADPNARRRPLNAAPPPAPGGAPASASRSASSPAAARPSSAARAPALPAVVDAEFEEERKR